MILLPILLIAPRLYVSLCAFILMSIGVLCLIGWARHVNHPVTHYRAVDYAYVGVCMVWIAALGSVAHFLVRYFW